MRKIVLNLLKKNASHWLVLLIDVILVCLSFVLSYSVRFENSFEFQTEKLLIQLPLIIVLAAGTFWLIGSNRGIIRHTGIRDAINVLLANSVLSIIILSIVAINLLFKIAPSFTIPKSIIFIHYFINVFMLIISRFIFKEFYEIISSELNQTTKVLIYGAGESGLITYGALKNDLQNDYEVFGFVDDDKSKEGKKIDGVKIYKRRELTKVFVEKNKIKEIIFTMQKIKPERFLYLTDKAMIVGLKTKIVPPLSNWIDGQLDVNQIKQVKIEDLLDRKPISIENPIINKDLHNKIILITGAAGSIGSEISRQISLSNYKHLVLIDQAESALYDLQQELVRKGIENFTSIVGNVRDIESMNTIFEKHKPNKVFHAAAYKHVPLMERNPFQAVKTNIEGTKNIANLSVKHNIDTFVMVSTDKAVNPTNIMGATKRIAEIYVSCLAKEHHNTKFTTTRFGNVLGSNGSVIPLFRKQIEEGGPLTVTHKEITRYFMTIPEACQLVIEAGTMGNGGEIYIFDMGKSIKIFDIAKKMIHLSGLNYPKDIDIKITGLRPGEKLYEELLADGENTTPTYHKKIMIAKTSVLRETITKETIDTLCNDNNKHDHILTVKLMKDIVPEFKSKNSTYTSLDK